MQCHQAHAPGGVAGKAVGGHVGHDVAAVVNVGGLPEGRVGAAGVMVVAAEHDRPDFAGSDHLVELQGDLHAPQGILVKDARPGADHQPVLLCIADPTVVVAVLETPLGVDALHGGAVGLSEIVIPAAQAYPAEGAVAVVEEKRPHNVLDIRLEDEPVERVLAVFADVPDAGVVDRLEKAVAVVEEVGSAVGQGLDEFIVMPQGRIHHFLEPGVAAAQQFRALLEADPLGAIAALVDGVAGSLVR